LGSFLAAGLVDEAAVFVAPRLMADERGQAITLGDEVNRIADARQLMLHRVRRSGDDALLLFSTRELTA
jgi:riboflavin biosynthesis pyrimidine reductase